MFEKFRNNSLNNYGLNPSHYLSTPGLCWYAMPEMAKIALELIPYIDMHIFFEKGARGRISYISNSYSKANKKYLKSYDPKQELKHICLDAKNVYVYGMSNFFPTNRFKYIDAKQFDLNKYTSKSSKGYVLDVYLEFPKELQELHINYPLAPDKIETKREMLSEYQLNIADLYNKEKYVFHYENLTLYLRLGLTLKKIHRVLEFNQSQWFKSYIKFITQKNKSRKKIMTKMEKHCTS